MSLFKYVPDATGHRHFADDLTVDRDDVDGLLSELDEQTVDRDDVDGLLSELDEYAVDQALEIAEEADDAEVTVLTVGLENAKDALRKALSMGADKTIQRAEGRRHAAGPWQPRRAIEQLP